MDQVRIDFLPETVESLRQQNAVDAILHVAVIAANMHLPEFILRHARRVQQHLLKRGVFTLAHGLNLVDADCVGDRPQARARFARAPRPGCGHNYWLKLHRRIRSGGLVVCPEEAGGGLVAAFVEAAGKGEESIAPAASGGAARGEQTSATSEVPA